jgi:hypothetical protein
VPPSFARIQVTVSLSSLLVSSDHPARQFELVRDGQLHFYPASINLIATIEDTPPRGASRRPSSFLFLLYIVFLNMKKDEK